MCRLHLIVLDSRLVTLWESNCPFGFLLVMSPLGSSYFVFVFLSLWWEVWDNCIDSWSLPSFLFFIKKGKRKVRECHNHKSQPFPGPKRKRKPTNLNKHKPNKCTKSTTISSLFPKRGNRNAKRTEKHKNKMTHGKTYNKSLRRLSTKQQRVRLTPLGIRIWVLI